MTSTKNQTVSDLAMKLYDQCWNTFPPYQLLYQQDLQNLNIVPPKDLSLLLNCTQYLVDQRLFNPHQDSHNRLAWKTVSLEDAEKLKTLDADENAVHNAIYNAGRAGLWHRSIQNKSGVLKAEVERCIKSLEGKRLIKLMHIKSSKKKMYMLYNLQPSVDVTGGAWFTDGVLDTEFISQLSGWAEREVSKLSWYEVEPPSDIPGKKRQKTNKGEAKPSRPKIYLPFPAAYNKYPTVKDLTIALNKSQFTPVRMDENSMKELLQVLCFDNKLVEMDGGQYKSLKNPDEVHRAQKTANRSNKETKLAEFKRELGRNGMTEAPCGQCPVFNLCQPGGAVNPENCEYFGPWMEKVLGF